MKPVSISAVTPQDVLFTWYQPGKVARLNCTGFSCAVAETDLPFTPACAAVNAAQGEFRMTAFTPEQLAQLRAGRAYAVRVKLVNGTTPIQDFRFTLVAR